MEQLRSFADDRLIRGCIYCGGPDNTRDHVPSKILLDPPLPENLPVVGACYMCNNGFSADEEYLACLIESAIAGSTDPDNINRQGVAKILRRSPKLQARIEASKTLKDGKAHFEAESHRVENILLKLARGHAAFELSQPCKERPISIWWVPLAQMSDEERDSFDASHVVQLFGEVGSRGLQRLLVTQVTLSSATGDLSTIGLLINDWIDVQEGRYRYLAIDDGNSIRIKIIISEYLACEVTWER